jgi:DNA-binding MarR family transcriptional regulator
VSLRLLREAEVWLLIGSGLSRLGDKKMKIDIKLPSHHLINSITEEFPEIDLLTIRVIFRMVMFGQGLFNTVEKHFGRYGLTKGKFHSLSYLFFNRKKKYIVLSELAKEIRVTKSTITGLIDGLEKLEYVERYTDKTIDRRKVFVRITELGETFFKTIFPNHIKSISTMFKDIESEELVQFMKTFEKISDNFKDFSIEPFDFEGADDEA